MSKLNLYYNNSDERCLVKTLQYFASYYNIKLLDDTNVFEPTILLKRIEISSFNDFINCNYCYLSVTNRYYFITDYEMLKGGIVALKLKCDVLMSFSQQIGNLQGLVLRNEFNSTPYYIDEELPFLSGRIIERKEIANSVFKNNTFNDESPCIALTVTGGVE